MVDQTQLVEDDSLLSKSGSGFVTYKSHLPGSEFQMSMVPEAHLEESFPPSAGISPEVEQGSISLIDHGMGTPVGKEPMSTPPLENPQEPVKPSWEMAVKPEETGDPQEPVKPSWEIAVKPEETGKLYEPEAFVRVTSTMSVFYSWEILLNLALEYAHDRVVPFVLHVCLFEAQKYGSDLASAWTVFMECRRGLIFNKRRDLGDSWDGILISPHHMPGGFVDSYYESEEHGNQKESAESASNTTVIIRQTLTSGNN